MITLHYLENSRAQRILWMLEELEVPYQIEVYKREPKTNLAPASLFKVHPLGRAPILTDGEETLAESGAIVDYLAHTYGDGRLVPTSPKDLQQYRFWTHFAEGSMSAFLVMDYVYKQAGQKTPFLLRPMLTMLPKIVGKVYLNDRIKSCMEYTNAHLQENEYFAGDQLSGADVMMSFPLETGLTRAKGQWPHIERYIKQIHAMPSYQRALKATPLQYAYA